MTQVRDVNEIFMLIASEFNYPFTDEVVGAGYDYASFILAASTSVERLLFALTDVNNLPENYSDGSSAGIVQKWSIFPVLDEFYTKPAMANKLTEIYYKLRLFFEQNSFVINNKVSVFDTWKIDGEVLSGMASLTTNAKGASKEEYQYFLELYLRK